MIIELIILAILICSLGGTFYILVRKIPVLNELPINGGSGIKKHRIIIGAEDKVKNILVAFKKQIFLHKILSWTKVITLKIETRIDHLLHKIRQ